VTDDHGGGGGVTDDFVPLWARLGRVDPPSPEVVEGARRRLAGLVAGVSDGPDGAGDGIRDGDEDGASTTVPDDSQARHAGRAAAHRIERRSSRPRRRVGATAVAVLLVAAIVVVVVAAHGRRVAVRTSYGQPPVTVPSVTRSVVTLPVVDVPAGTGALDFGRLRIYLPRGWTAISSCGNEQGVPGAEGSLVVGPATECGGSPKSTWLSLDGTPRWHPTNRWTPSRINGIRTWSRHEGGILFVDIPSLRASIDAHGPAAGRAVRTLGPSALDAVLAQTAPAAVPTGWKAIRFDGVQARVPAAWAIDAVTKQRSMPGVCNDPVFGSSEVLLGDDGFAVRCKLTVYDLYAPTNGLWIDSKDVPTTEEHVGVAWGSLPLTLLYSENQTDDLLEVTTTVDARRVQLVIGLGTDPSIAEEILSSLTTSTRPPSRPTVTNPTFSTITYGRNGSTVTSRPRRRTSVRSGDGKT
jgi:hypothetical protein